MTDLADPAPPVAPPLVRLEPVVFAHARIAMIVATTPGVVVEVNAAASELFGRHRYELVQEPIAHHVVLLSGRPLAECLLAASRSTEAVSFGPCSVRRPGGERGRREPAPAAWAMMELVVSSGCRVSGRDLLLLQLAPLPAGPADRGA